MSTLLSLPGELWTSICEAWLCDCRDLVTLYTEWQCSTQTLPLYEYVNARLLVHDISWGRARSKHCVRPLTSTHSTNPDAIAAVDVLQPKLVALFTWSRMVDTIAPRIAPSIADSILHLTVLVYFHSSPLDLSAFVHLTTLQIYSADDEFLGTPPEKRVHGTCPALHTIVLDTDYNIVFDDAFGSNVRVFQLCILYRATIQAFLAKLRFLETLHVTSHIATRHVAITLPSVRTLIVPFVNQTILVYAQMLFPTLRRIIAERSDPKTTLVVPAEFTLEFGSRTHVPTTFVTVRNVNIH